LFPDESFNGFTGYNNDTIIITSSTEYEGLDVGIASYAGKDRNKPPSYFGQ
jgi:hypothetical protein